MNGQEWLAQSAWAATLVLALAFIANRILKNAPAAWRHFLWTTVFAGLLILPVVGRIIPKWGLARVATPVSALVADNSVETAAPATYVAPPRVSPIPMLWFAGCLLVLLRYVAGQWRSYRLVRAAVDVSYATDLMESADARGIRVVQSAEARTALAAGIWRPVIVLPSDAGHWPQERLRAALLHELMHVRRRDLLTQTIAQLASCAYWFHPLVWLAARQQRLEREKACDDAVLARGIAPHDYAGHLVDAVRSARGRNAAALAMAEPSELETRIRALLDAGRDRRPLSRFAAGAMVAAFVVVLLPVASVTGHAQASFVWEKTEVAAPQAEPAAAVPTTNVAPAEQPRRRRFVAAGPVALAVPAVAEQASGIGAISGIVRDPSGARVPGCTVALRNQDRSVEQSVTTGPVGDYTFGGIPTGTYSLIVTAPGFKVSTRNVVAVPANQVVSSNFNLILGGVLEAVSVTAPKPPGVPASPSAMTVDSGRIRVGGNVQPAMVIKKVAPLYSEALKSQGISGTVQLVAILDKQGSVKDIRVLSSPDPGLSTAATDAVAQWIYRPALLNGEPVSVEIQIDVTFGWQ